jgi:hypothetical protein
MKENDAVCFNLKNKIISFLLNLGEELLRRIRERHGKNTTKQTDDVPPPPPTSASTHLLVPPV